VIGYDKAHWLQEFLHREGKPVSHRSHAEALRLANDLYERLSHTPSRFDEFVAEYSEHRDAERGGDFGEWSTDEPSPFPREVEILRGLRVGEVHRAIDSLFGFEIIQRTPHMNRVRYTMTSIGLRFDPARRPSDPHSKAAVLARMKAFASEVAREPGRFSELQNELCCTDVRSWVAGRDTPALENALDRLQIGEIAREPLESDRWYLIPKRLGDGGLQLLSSSGHSTPAP
jgi:hypothetical protein